MGIETLAVKHPHVLLVEDSPEERLLYSYYLRRSGMRVSEALEGNECLEKTVLLMPDAILLHLRLPEMDQWDTFLCLKMEPTTRHVPVIVITECDGLNVDILGADGLLTKPCMPESMAREIQRVLFARDEKAAPNPWGKMGGDSASWYLSDPGYGTSDGEIWRLNSNQGFDRLPD